MLNRVKFKQKDINGTALLASFLFPYEKPLMFQFYAAALSGFQKVEVKSTTPVICPTKHGEIANCFNANRAKE